MLEGWAIVALAVGYLGILFAIAWIGDRIGRARKNNEGRPLVYALSLAVYCSSWTFFGSVGLAAAAGYDFIPIYLGPILMFTLGAPLIVRVVRLAKSQNLTSLADFLAARYGRSPPVAATVTLAAAIGMLPYIALQLKAIVVSTETLFGGSPPIPMAETALVVTVALTLFAILFGTRHIDASEHQHGLMLAIAAESVVKLAAFVAVGVFAMVSVFGGIGDFAHRIRIDTEAQAIFGRPFNGGTWLTLLVLSAVCILMLPRQFHVTVVENTSEREIACAVWLFPLYLVLFNLFVVPIAAAAVLTLPKGQVDADMYVLALPIAREAGILTAIAYIGGLSAATAMVIVESVALAIMVCNGLVIPLLLRRHFVAGDRREDVVRRLLLVRRAAIVAILLLGWAVYHALARVHGLAAIGLVSFAAIAQLAPAFLGGLLWRNGTARGAIAGIAAGFALWTYTLLVPWTVKAGWLPASLLTHGPFGLAFLQPQALFYLEFEPLAHGVLWSLAANVLAYVTVSLLRAPEPIERMQARIFVADETPRGISGAAFGRWRTAITVAELEATVARYLGCERAARSFREYAAGRNGAIAPHCEADIHVLRFTEHLLTSAIGAASSRLVLSLLLGRSHVDSRSALKLLDDASEALQYNRDLLQSALDQVGQGLSVFDKDMRLICWNRQFRGLLNLPPHLGRVGVRLDHVLRACAERGDFGPGPVDALVAERLRRLAVTKETFQERIDGGNRVLEIRTAPMPQGGIVTTYTDITERAAAAATLERRVRERTAELAEAKAKADAANLDKTRFITAASHDILQPLNAARLYATSLTERPLDAASAVLAHRVDASLEAVEEILGTLIDISRMDSGSIAPEIAGIALADLFEQL
ncbi:MAG: PAS-domain containing protein, partial [Hyphomicrobiaceae bacterium]